LFAFGDLPLPVPLLPDPPLPAPLLLGVLLGWVPLPDPLLF
jgi:hypothetical protein